MTAVAIATRKLQVPAKLEQEVLSGSTVPALHICEAELRYQLRWDERRDGRCSRCSTSWRRGLAEAR